MRGGAMGSPGPPQAPIFLHHFLLLFSAPPYLRPCYHALRHPFGAADRAMLLN